jgi:hypothetical protein
LILETAAVKGKPSKIAKHLAKTRGYSYPEWEYLAEKDPEFLEAYNRLSGQAVNILMQVTSWTPASERKKTAKKKSNAAK